MASSTQYYHHGPTKFTCGITLPDVFTAYRTHGDPKNPCILNLTWYTAILDDLKLMIGSGKPLDTDEYFVVTMAALGNGESSSPSNTPPPYNGPNFPRIAHEDTVRCQYEVLTKQLGVKTLYAVVGISAGGQQAYHWAVMYPDFVERLIAIVTAARTSEHTKSFCAGARDALVNSKDFNDGNYTATPTVGLKVFSRVMAPWFWTPTWFAQCAYSSLGIKNLETFLSEVWDPTYFRSSDANDFLASLRTWSNADVSLANGGDGDLVKTLRNIKAKTLLLPVRGDMVFPPEHAEFEASHIPNAKVVVIDSIWGHMAPGSPENLEFVSQQISEFFKG